MAAIKTLTGSWFTDKRLHLEVVGPCLFRGQQNGDDQRHYMTCDVFWKGICAHGLSAAASRPRGRTRPAVAANGPLWYNNLLRDWPNLALGYMTYQVMRNDVTARRALVAAPDREHASALVTTSARAYARQHYASRRA